MESQINGGICRTGVSLKSNSRLKAHNAEQGGGPAQERGQLPALGSALPPRPAAPPALPAVALALEVEVQVQDAALEHALEAALVVVLPGVGMGGGGVGHRGKVGLMPAARLTKGRTAARQHVRAFTHSRHAGLRISMTVGTGPPALG